MDSSISLIRSLATTLLSEIDLLSEMDKTSEPGGSVVLSEMVRDFEIKLIRTALLKTGGNQRRAASILGVKTTTLHNKIKTYGIESNKITA